MTSKRILAGIVILGALVLTAACAAPGQEPTATPAAAKTPTASGPTAVPSGSPTATAIFGQIGSIDWLDKKFPYPPKPVLGKPVKGGTMHVDTTKWPPLDPVKIHGIWATFGAYDHLIEQDLDWRDPVIQSTVKMRPQLAESWDNPDPLTYVLHLVKGVKFQNIPPVNGRELTSEDVKFAIEVYQKGGYREAKVSPIAKIETPDKYTVKLTLKQPYAGFIEFFGSPVVAQIFAKEAYEAEGGLAKNVVGTGPYIAKEIKEGESFLMVRNPDYWQKDKDGVQLPYIDNIKGFVMSDISAQIAAFRSSQTDLTALVSLRQVQDVLKTNPDLFLYRVPSAIWGTLTMYYRLDKKPFNDVRVRQAISMAIDRDRQVKTLYDGDGDKMGPLPWVWTYPEWPRPYDKMGKYFQYNPTEAKKLLAEAGYPNGFKMTFQYAELGTGIVENGALMVQEDLRQIGITVDLKRLEAAAKEQLRAEGNWEDVLYDTYYVAGPGLDDMIWFTWHSTASKNGVMSPDRVNDPKIDQLLEKRKATPDAAEQKKLLLQLYDYLGEQQYRGIQTVYFRYEIQQPWLKNAASAPYNWFRGYGYYQQRASWLEGAPKR